MTRSIAAAAALVALASCTVPRTAIAVGTVTTVVGALAYREALEQPTEMTAFGGGIAGGLESLAGTAMVLLGAGLIVSGMIGLDQEPREAPLGPLAQGPTAAATMRASFAPPRSATAVLAARSDQLAAQLQLEARAGHCEAATAIARRLARLDRARTIALIERDDQVSSCVGYQR